MKLSIRHKTHYEYADSVSFSPHRIFLRPRENHNIFVHEMDITCSPNASLRWMKDPFGNTLAVAYFEEKSGVMDINAKIELDITEDNPFDFIIDSNSINYPFTYREHERDALAPYLMPCDDSSEVFGWLSAYLPRKEGTLDLLLTLNQAVRENMQYERRDDEGVQTPNETLAVAKGSCRDFAQLFVAACRTLDIAARFVSGYLYDPPTGDEDYFYNRAVGAMHAWAEVYLPGAGWKGFDPTNGILTNHFFMATAVAHLPELVNPIQGSYYSDQQTPSSMSVSLEIDTLN